MKPRTSVYIATSLDGFIARKNGDIDWLEQHDAGGDDDNGIANDYGYHAFISTVDTLVMGRSSFEKVLSFGIGWPYEVPVVVMSRTLTNADLPDDLRGKVEVSSATPAELVAQLGEAGVQHLYIDGGKVIQSFMREGLINELIISRLPVLLGEGIPLFGPLAADITLEHLATTAFTSGLVQSHYRVNQPV